MLSVNVAAKDAALKMNKEITNTAEKKTALLKDKLIFIPFPPLRKSFRLIYFENYL